MLKLKLLSAPAPEMPDKLMPKPQQQYNKSMMKKM